MLKVRPLILVFLTALLSGQFLHAQFLPPTTGQANISKGEFVVGPLEITMPKGAFLLIRKGREVGAIRFTSIEPTETDEPGKAAYESYFQGNGSGLFLTANVVKLSGVIDLHRLTGIGRLSFQTGSHKVRVGKWSFACNYPGRVNMWPYDGEQRDYGFEFAPTSAREIAEVDASDARLKWFRYYDGESIYMMVSDLPK